MVWDHDAFDKLVLPQGQKNFIQDLVIAQGSGPSNDFDDFIQGKGRSLIGLLSGPPGVGKTLTAEAIAELTERPLYKLSSGELGETSSSVQKKLTEVLKLAQTWNAVLLLDEADVFLSARSENDLIRTAITSIFLKELEYYNGILLMTTNRLESMDSAFQSRIHFHYVYEELSEDTRVRIWHQFIKKIRDNGSIAVDVGDTELAQLGKLSLNARQIKNVLRTAHLVAERRSKTLTSEIIENATQFASWNRYSKIQPSVELI